MLGPSSSAARANVLGRSRPSSTTSNAASMLRRECKNVGRGEQRRKVEHDDARLVALLSSFTSFAILREPRISEECRLRVPPGSTTRPPTSGMDQQLLDGRHPTQVVAETGPGRQAKAVADAGLAQVGVHEQCSLVELLREADRQVDRDQRLAFALAGARHRQHVPFAFPQPRATPASTGSCRRR